MYGLSRSEVESHLHKNCIVVLDVGGVKTMKELYPDAVSIFILPPDRDELRRRLTSRNTNDQVNIESRLDAISRELSEVDSFDYHVEPGDYNTTTKSFNDIISAIL